MRFLFNHKQFLSVSDFTKVLAIIYIHIQKLAHPRLQEAKRAEEIQRALKLRQPAAKSHLKVGKKISTLLRSEDGNENVSGDSSPGFFFFFFSSKINLEAVRREQCREEKEVREGARRKNVYYTQRGENVKRVVVPHPSGR